MSALLETFEKTYRKPQVTAVRSGDAVRVHQRITEGGKERTQVFEGVVIRTHRLQSHTATITVRRMIGGIGVEKTFMLHAPNVEKVEVVRRSKVRRNYLSYLRDRQGKAARLREVGFDRAAVEARAEASAGAQRQEEVSSETSSESSKQEAENQQADEPKDTKKADRTATTKNQADTKPADDAEDK